jgi:hypothetical protein
MAANKKSNVHRRRKPRVDEPTTQTTTTNGRPNPERGREWANGRMGEWATDDASPALPFSHSPFLPLSLSPTLPFSHSAGGPAAHHTRVETTNTRGETASGFRQRVDSHSVGSVRSRARSGRQAIPGSDVDGKPVLPYWPANVSGVATGTPSPG